MKWMATCLLIFSGLTTVSGQGLEYVASTPAGSSVRSFLGIPLQDSIDFIRWKLVFQDNHYALHCNFGISKPNTNGFYNGGNVVELAGNFTREKNYYFLENNIHTLGIVELNTDLLQLMDAGNNLLVGNGGWSYTLNSSTPLLTDQINIFSTVTKLTDSVVFEGRTPCNIPGIVASGTSCYKLKWRIILYAKAAGQPGSYKILGTSYRREGGRTGRWEIKTAKSGGILYQLNDDNGNGFIYLLKINEHLLLFTDASGKLLVGDADFSYTMNIRL